MNLFKLSENDFNKMLADKSFQVKQLGFEDGPDQKMKFKVGNRKVVTYEDGVINGIPVPNARAFVHFEDVEKEQIMKTRIITFAALDSETEIEIEKYIGTV